MVATFKRQADALLRKSATYQKRAIGTNCCLLSAPIFFCIVLALIQVTINKVFLSGDKYKCGCKCLQCCYSPGDGLPEVCGSEYLVDGKCPTDTDGYVCKQTDPNLCGLEYSSATQAAFCPVPYPSPQLAFQTVPETGSRASGSHGYSPALTVLATGQDPRLAEVLSSGLYSSSGGVGRDEIQEQWQLEQLRAKARGAALLTPPVYLLSMLGYTPGTTAKEGQNLYIETALTEGDMYYLVPSGGCSMGSGPGNSSSGSMSLVQLLQGFSGGSSGSSSSVYGNVGGSTNIACLEALPRMLSSAQALEGELYCGYDKARCDGTAKTNEYAAGYDWLNTSAHSFSLNVYYNSTPDDDNNRGRGTNFRLPQVLNLAAKSWWAYITGGFSGLPPMSLLGIMSMPKPSSELKLDFSSLLGPLFYTWVVQLLLPTFLQQLVYEKEKRLRMMMKMHGLGDGAYWLVTYAWYLMLYCAYIIIFIVFGSLIRLNMFIKTNYGLQIINYFLFGNVMIAFAFVLSSLFSSSKTSTVFAFLYVFASGLIGELMLKVFMNKNAKWIIALELVPAWGLYRSLFEISEYTFLAVYRDTKGLSFSNLGDSGNGIVVVWIIYIIEWPLLMLLAWYLEQVVSSGTGTRRHWLFCCGSACEPGKVHPHPGAAGGSLNDRDAEVAAAASKATAADGSSPVVINVRGAGGAGGEAEDVATERERVEAMTEADVMNHPVVVRNFKKVFPAMDGGKPKTAVRTMTLAMERGECFGLLGPNGAGKSTTINMLTGFLEPSHGTALVEGFDIRTDMQQVYKLMGVCPQHDLLWEQLTAEEHLLFYGRLKGLQGPELLEAVDAALKSVNLFNGGVGRKRSGKYSGGMKRRLSVAISFIGDPKVVYLDEPSTGLDPASRRALWEVVKGGKGGRAIVLTTHSMEEAEALCDRLGIFVDGRLVCLGNPKEITSRYAGYLVFTITVHPDQEQAARDAVMAMSPNARLTYELGGTLKYELPQEDVGLSGVFAHMARVKQEGQLQVLDWGVANATLEEVFIKLAKAVGAETREGH